MGWFDGLLGGGGDAGADDPYGGLLNKAQLSALQDRKWAALAGALADAGMPSRLPIPIGSAFGKAAAAFGGSGPEKDALEQIAIAQKVKQAQYEYGLKQKYAPILEKLLADQLGGGAKPLPVAAPASPAVATPVISAPVTPGRARIGAAADAAGAAATVPTGGGWGNNIPDKYVYGPQNPKPTGPYYGQPGYQDPPELAGAGGGDEGGLLADPNDPLSSLPPEIRQMLAARAQGGPAAGGTPATFPDDSRYTRMVAPASARTEDGVAGSSVDPLAAIEKYESGGRNIKQQVVGESGGYNPSTGTVTGPSSASGYFQMIDPTWRHAAKLAGIDPSPYPHAMDAPRDLQERAARALFNEQGYAPWAPYNSRLAAAVGYKGGRGGGGGPGPLAVLGGGAQTAQGVAEATDTPGLPPALQGLLALVGAGRGAASNDGLPPALQGLLSLMASRSGDPIEDVLANLRNSGSSTGPATAPPGAGEDTGSALYPPPTPGQLATLAAMRGGDAMGGGDTAGGPPAPTGPSGVPSGMPNIPTGVPNLGTGGLPAGMMKPPTLSLTPPGVPAAGGAPYDMSNARTLAIADAMAKLAGINMPFKELLDLSFKDPAYARTIAQQQEEAKQAAGAPYKAQEQTNQAVLDQWKAVNQHYLDKQKEWAAKGLTQDANGNLVALPNADKMGLTPNAIQQAQKDLENIRTQHKLLEQGKMLDPKDPTRIIPVPGFNETTAATERAKTAATEEEKALGTVKTIVIAGPDGKPREVDVTLKEAGEISRGMGNARLGIPAMNAPAPAAGGPAPGRPYYSPEHQEELKARGQATVKQAETVDTEAKNAQSSRDTLTLVMNDLRNVHQGWGADTAYNFGRVMQVFDPAFKQSVASYESAEKALAEMTGKLVRATDPNPTLQQSERLLKSMPVRLNSEGGNERLYNRMAGFQDEAVNKSIAQQQYAKANGGTTSGFDGYWHQNVSPIAFVFRRMPSDQQAQMVLNLRQTESGKAELEKLKGQIDFIEKNGLTR